MAKKTCLRCSDGSCPNCRKKAYQKAWRNQNKEALLLASKRRWAESKRTKTCPCCRRELGVKEFALQKDGERGLARREECNDCVAKRVEEWRLFHLQCKKFEREENE